MNYALNARAELALARVFENINPELSEHHRECAYERAHSVGYQTTAISPYFEGEPLLLKGQRDGIEENVFLDAYMAEQLMETYFETGSIEEWKALSKEQQEAKWDEFHHLCAQGVGDEMYFYRVLMNQWLVGYVGH